MDRSSLLRTVVYLFIIISIYSSDVIADFKGLRTRLREDSPCYYLSSEKLKRDEQGFFQ